MNILLNKFKEFLQKPHYIFALIALIGTILSSLIVPFPTVNDEHSHFIRTYEMSNFSLAKTVCRVPEQFTADDFKGPVNNEVKHSCYTASNYNPILHLPQALGMLFAKIFTNNLEFMIISGRIFNALTYVLILFSVIRFIRKESYVWFVVAISLIPMSLHSAGSLSGDSVNNSIVIAFIAITLKYVLNQKVLSRKDLLVLTIVSILVLSTKITNAPLLMMTLLIPASSFNFFKKVKKPFRKYLILGVIGLLAVIPSFSWQLYAKDSAAMHPLNYGILSNSSNPIDYTKKFLKLTYNTYLNPFTNEGYGNNILQGVTDTFSSFKYSMPDAIILVLWIIIFTALIIKIPAGMYNISHRKLLFISSLSMVLFSILVSTITYGLYTAWTARVMGEHVDYALGVQGRYFTALLALFIPAGIYISRYIASVNFKNKNFIGLTIFIIFGLIIAFYIYQSHAWSIIYYSTK